MFEVITMGSALRDVFLSTEIKEKNKMICFPTDEKILVKDINFSVGGGGINSSFAFKKLGINVGFIGKIGDDENGNEILKKIKEEKINFIGNISKKYNTGYSVIIDSIQRTKALLTYKGANENLNYSEINFEKLKTNWFYFATMIGKSFETQEKLSYFAEKNGIKLVYNPSSYQTSKGIKPIEKILKRTEILILNKEEAKMLIKNGDLIKELLKTGPRIVCITDGERECKVCDGGFIYSARPHKVKVVERTGAGDAFGAGFISGLIKSSNIETAIQYGILNGESVVQYIGARNGLLTEKEIIKRIKNNPVKIYKERLI